MIHARHIGFAALAGVAFSAACACPGPPCTFQLTGIDGGVFLENSEASVLISQPVPFGCEESVEVDHVTTEVLDDTNDLVPSTATNVEQISRGTGQDFIELFVKFQAGEPGWYHVRAGLEPALSVVQGEVVVARDRLAVKPTATATDCSRAHLTSSGTAFCGAAVVGDGGFSNFAASILAVRGDVVWSWNTSGVSRWRDGDGGLFREPALPLDNVVQQQPRVITPSASGDEAYVATTAEVSRIAVRNGVLVELSSIPLGAVITPTIGFASNGTCFLVDDGPSGAMTVTTKVRVCGYALAGDILTKLASCEEVTGLPLGVVDGALWFRDEVGLRALVGDPNGKLVTAATLRPPPLATKQFKQTLSPILELSGAGGWLIPRLLSGRPFFDRYQTLDATFTSGNASESAVFFSGTQGTRIFAR